MSVWAVLCAHGSDLATLGRAIRVLSGCLDDLVVEGMPTVVPGRGEPPGDGDTPLGHLLAGLRAVPDEVDVVVYVESDALAAVEADVIVEMLGWLAPDVDAVASATPVTDALKHVDGGDGRLLGSVDRSELVTLQTPQVIRREALDDALLALPHGGPHDPAALLTATGHVVRAFRPAAHAPGRATVKDTGHVAR